MMTLLRSACSGRAVLTIVLGLAVLLNGAEFRNTATTGYNFLNLPVSSRFASLGETGISLPDMGSEALFVNPALSAFHPGKGDLSLSYGDWYLDTEQNAAAYIRRFSFLGTLGLSLYHFDFGSTVRTRNFAPEEVAALQDGDLNTYRDLGKYSSAAYAAALHFARKTTGSFAYGLSLNYIQETIAEYSASNMAFNVGFMYFTGIGSIRVASYLKNFGLEGAYVYEKFKLPQSLSLGVSGELIGSMDDPTRLTLLLEAVNPNDIGEHLHLGGEFRWQGLLTLRAGYKFAYDAEDLSLGLGTRFTLKGRSVRLDLAYMDHDYLQSTLRTSLSLEL